jgi:hypothetical protein
MKRLTGIALIVVTLGCSQADRSDSPAPKPTPSAEAASAPQLEAPQSETPLEPTAAQQKSAKIVPLTPEQQADLLAARVDGGLGNEFRQYANMFLVFSRLQLGSGVGLMTSSPEIAAAELQPVFPSTYQPTLRELLDMIAMQTGSSWKYDSSGKYFQSDVPGESAATGLAIFEFTPAKRDKPYEVTLAKEWKAVDKGHWLMLVPPSFPVGMDIYELGSYSTDDKAAPSDWINSIRGEIALEWAQRVNPEATRDDLQPAKVGPYDALYFEALIDSQLDKKLRWRQWVFAEGNRCYFIVSTILPEKDEEIFPDVEQMVGSIRIKGAAP